MPFKDEQPVVEQRLPLSRDTVVQEVRRTVHHHVHLLAVGPLGADSVTITPQPPPPGPHTTQGSSCETGLIEKARRTFKKKTFLFKNDKYLASHTIEFGANLRDCFSVLFLVAQ